jgi:hypothetical protein
LNQRVLRAARLWKEVHFAAALNAALIEKGGFRLRA